MSTKPMAITDDEIKALKEALNDLEVWATKMSDWYAKGTAGDNRPAWPWFKDKDTRLERLEKPHTGPDRTDVQPPKDPPQYPPPRDGGW